MSLYSMKPPLASTKGRISAPSFVLLASSSRRVFPSIPRVTLVSTLLLTSVSGVSLTLRERREWRTIGSGNRSVSRKIQCLSKLLHNPEVAATVDPALSLIPPVSQNISYFDGGLLPVPIIPFVDPD